jgi:hypothetical protein
VIANMDVGPYQKIAAGSPMTWINRTEVHKNRKHYVTVGMLSKRVNQNEPSA